MLAAAITPERGRGAGRRTTVSLAADQRARVRDALRRRRRRSRASSATSSSARSSRGCSRSPSRTTAARWTRSATSCSSRSRRSSRATPEIPFVSTVTGEWSRELGSTRVLVAQRPRAGRFAGGARAAARRRLHDLPRARPAPGARRRPSTSASRRARPEPCCRSLRRSEDERETMLRSLGALCTPRVGTIDWSGLYGERTSARRAAPLPWQHERHWFEDAPRATRLDCPARTAVTRCCAAAARGATHRGNRRSASPTCRTSRTTVSRASRSSRRPRTSRPGSRRRAGCGHERPAVRKIEVERALFVPAEERTELQVAVEDEPRSRSTAPKPTPGR